MVCIVVTLASSMLFSDAAHAERTLSATLPVNWLSIDPCAAFVTEVSKSFTAPEHWIRAVMRVEKRRQIASAIAEGRHGADADHAEDLVELRARYGLGADPYDLRDIILAGAAYMRELHDRCGAPGFLAACNAGPRRYEHHLATGRADAGSDPGVCRDTRIDDRGQTDWREDRRGVRSLPRSDYHCLSRAPRATHPTIGRRMACTQIVH